MVRSDHGGTFSLSAVISRGVRSGSDFPLLSSDRRTPQIWHLLIKGTQFHDISGVLDLSISNCYLWACREAKSSYSVSVALCGFYPRGDSTYLHLKLALYCSRHLHLNIFVVSLTTFLWWRKSELHSFLLSFLSFFLTHTFINTDRWPNCKGPVKQWNTIHQNRHHTCVLKWLNNKRNSPLLL